MISAKDVSTFTDPDDPSTPPMEVTVVRQGRISQSYRVPAGFQLDLYVNSLFPSFTLKVEAIPEKIVVSAMHNDIAIETHEGNFKDYYEAH